MGTNVYTNNIYEVFYKHTYRNGLSFTFILLPLPVEVVRSNIPSTESRHSQHAAPSESHLRVGGNKGEAPLHTGSLGS